LGETKKRNGMTGIPAMSRQRSKSQIEDMMAPLLPCPTEFGLKQQVEDVEKPNATPNQRGETRNHLIQAF
jgi:hypothetical protein